MLDYYDQRDIAQHLVAVTVAMLSASMAQNDVNVEYVRGILDTARAHALNYGIPWAAVSGELAQALDDAGRGELLGMVDRQLLGGEK